MSEAHVKRAGADAPAPADVPGVASMLRILGDETRLALLLALIEGEKDVSTLWATLRMPQPSVSHHLAVLRTGHLVSHRRSGKRMYYSLGPAASKVGPATIRIECPNFAMTIELRDGGGPPAVTMRPA